MKFAQLVGDEQTAIISDEDLLGPNRLTPEKVEALLPTPYTFGVLLIPSQLRTAFLTSPAYDSIIKRMSPLSGGIFFFDHAVIISK